MRVTQKQMQTLEDLSTQIIEEGRAAEERLRARVVNPDDDLRKLSMLVAQLGRITKLQTQLLRSLI